MLPKKANRIDLAQALEARCELSSVAEDLTRGGVAGRQLRTNTCVALPSAVRARAAGFAAGGPA